MSWLHTWCGLVCGWLLCAIFLTGTLSVFREPITRWMEAAPVAGEGARPLAEPERLRAVQVAQHYLEQAAPQASLWRIELPGTTAQPVKVLARTAHGPVQVTLSAVTAEVLAEPLTRQTEGGRHFMSFHYSLQGGIAGFWAVGLVSMCMLVALVSGVIVHRRIFLDFFTFRPGKGQRSWLDAHNASAVLTLPFLFMIVYTGLAYFYTSYMPWPLQAVYGSERSGRGHYQAELQPRAKAQGVTHAPGSDLVHFMQHAQTLLTQPVARIVVQRLANGTSTVRVIEDRPDTGASRRLLNKAESVSFEADTGRVLEVPQRTTSDGAAAQVHPVIGALHLATFGGWTMKWLYFFCGLIGTAMVATGSLLFAVKRRTKSGNEWGAATPRMYCCIDALNVAALTGSALASIAYLYGNRLLPLALEARSGWEIRVFFAVWALSLLHALLRSTRQAWCEQLWAVALLCLALPLLNALTTGQHLGLYLAQGDGQRAGLELTSMALGLLVAWGALRHARSGRKPVPRAGRIGPARGAA